jgi:hypothetical protein
MTTLIVTEEATDFLATWKWGQSHYTKERSAKLLSHHTRDSIEYQSDQARAFAGKAIEELLRFLGRRSLPTREQIAAAIHDSEMLHKRGDDCPPACDVTFLRRADAVLTLFNGAAAPTEQCGATNPRVRGECVFIAGHHDRNSEDWTPHGNVHGWTWNDQPAEDAS